MVPIPATSTRRQPVQTLLRFVQLPPQHLDLLTQPTHLVFLVFVLAGDLVVAVLGTLATWLGTLQHLYLRRDH